MTFDQAYTVLDAQRQVADHYVRYDIFTNDHCSGYYEGRAEALTEALNLLTHIDHTNLEE